MIRSLMKLCVLVVISATATAQTLVATTKPILSPWSPTDFASVEVRVKGRLSTDPSTTHRIIGRVTLKGLDISMLTQRVPISVPATQTWEVKSISVNFVPIVSTGVAAFEIPLQTFAKSYFPPPGQVMAIDADAKTGNVVLGPVTPPVVPPVVTPPPPPAPTAFITADGTWTLEAPDPNCEGGIKTVVKLNGVSKGAADEIRVCSGALYARDGTTWYQGGAASSCGGSGWVRQAGAPC